jgi:hypothetical protein
MKAKMTVYKGGGKAPASGMGKKVVKSPTGGKAPVKSYANGGKPPMKPAEKPVPKAKPQMMTQGQSLGSMIKKGNYAGVAKEAGESLMGAPKELLGAFKRAAKFQNGGKIPKPGFMEMPKSKKATTSSRKMVSEGEVLGSMLKKGDYKGAANMVGKAFADAPDELYRAFKRSLK